MPSETKIQHIYYCSTCNRGWGATANISAPKYWQCSQCSYKKKINIYYSLFYNYIFFFLF
jgi:DNA-directed RNA polymerase subunit RPC12/RpoP